MQQKTICVAPVSLLSVESSGKPTSKGKCACALVALPSHPPKYSVVCYTSASSTLCVARLEGRNERGARVTLQKSGHVDFTDESNQRWSALFNKEEQRDNFVAQLSLAFYLLNGRPEHRAVSADFSPKDGGMPLALHHRGNVFYRAYQTKESDGLLEISRLIEETSHDTPYSFQPFPSNVTLPGNYKGFEAEVLRMTEGSLRGIVVPYDIPCAPSDTILVKQSALPTVFIVSLVRIEQVDYSKGESMVTPSVFATDASPDFTASQEEGALVLASHHHDPAPNTNLLTPYSPSIPSTSGGIPIEQMSLLQKVGVGISNATLYTSELRDVVEGVASNWKSRVNRPPPTRLSNKELEEQVRLFIAENEAVKEELLAKENGIAELDKMNCELQKRIDEVSKECQDIINGRARQHEGMRDSKVEKNRLALRLQDQLAAVSTQRDDVERHVSTLKKLIDVSKDELKQTEAKQRLLEMQISTEEEQLNVAEVSLKEVQVERVTLEGLLSELKNTETARQRDLRSLSSQLDTLASQAEKDKLHLQQLAQDERLSREAETREMRAEVMRELKNNEIKFRAERSRLVKEKYDAGREEGKRLGAEAAMEDVSLHQQSLRLDLQRAQTAVDACKEELRDHIAESITSRRGLLSRITELRQSLSSLVREKVELTHKISLYEAGRGGRQEALQNLRFIFKHLDHPVKSSQMLSVVTALERGDSYIDIAFNQENWEKTVQEVHRQRCQWIEEELYDICAKGLEHYYQEWLKPLQEWHSHTVSEVKKLWVEQYGEMHYSIIVAEKRGRFSIVQESDSFFNTLEQWWALDREERDKLWRTAESSAHQLFEQFLESIQALQSACMEQIEQRENLRKAETTGRRSIELEEHTGRVFLPDVFNEWCREVHRESQRLMVEEEEYERASIEAEEYAQLGVLQVAWEQSRQWLEEERRRQAQQHEVMEAESNARELMEIEHEAGVLSLRRILKDSLNPPPLPALYAQEEAPPRAPIIPSTKDSDQERSPPSVHSSSEEEAPAPPTPPPPVAAEPPQTPPPPVPVERAELRTPSRIPQSESQSRLVNTQEREAPPPMLDGPPPTPSDSEEDTPPPPRPSVPAVETAKKPVHRPTTTTAVEAPKSSEEKPTKAKETNKNNNKKETSPRRRQSHL